MKKKSLWIFGLVILSSAAFGQKSYPAIEKLEKIMNEDLKKGNYYSAAPAARKIYNIILQGVGDELGTLFPKRCGPFEMDTLTDVKVAKGFVEGEIDIQRDYYLPGKNQHQGVAIAFDTVKLDPGDPNAYGRMAPPIIDPSIASDPFCSMTINNSAMKMQAIAMVHSALPGQGPQISPAETARPLRIKGYRAMIKESPTTKTKEVSVLIGATTLSIKARNVDSYDFMIPCIEKIDFEKIESFFGK